MRTCSFFGHEITRLIVGDNPFNGHSYIEDIIPGSEMKEYYHTENRFYEALFEIEKTGINCILPLAMPVVVDILSQYRRDGGKMRIIFQPYPAEETAENIRRMAAVEPVAVYHQGTTTDYLYESGQTEKIKETISMYHAMGIPVGLGTHRPDVIELSEEENWDVDFYVACLQNARRGREGAASGFVTGKTKMGLLFYPEDRPVMLELIKKVQKPCIAYKIFAGGQMFMHKTEDRIRGIIKEAYREVFSAVKPNDLAAIGIFQKYKDQLREDCELFNETMDEMEAEKR